MKKILAFVFILSLCFACVSCVNDGNSNEKNKDSSTEISTDGAFSLNEAGVIKDLKFTATELKENKGNDYFEPSDNNVFVGIKFEIENISNKEQSVSSLLLFDAYVDEVKSEYSFNASSVFSEGTLDGSIASGKKLVGWYSLEVPENWVNIELNIKEDLFSNKRIRFVFSKDTSDIANSSISEDISIEETYSLNEFVVIKNLKFTAIELKENKGNDYFEPSDNNVFVGIKFEIENISDKEQAVSSLLFDAYVDGVKSEYSFSASCVFDEGTLSGNIAPGKKLVGWYSLEVPENWGDVELIVRGNTISNDTATFVFEK